MARKGSDSFSPSGFNGPDPTRDSNHHETTQSYYKDLQNGDSNVGDGNRSSRAFASNDDNSGYSKDFLDSVNYIDSNAPGVYRQH